MSICKSCELEQAIEEWQQNQNNFGHDKLVLSLQDRVYSQELEKRIMLEYMLMSWKRSKINSDKVFTVKAEGKA